MAIEAEGDDGNVFEDLELLCENQGDSWWEQGGGWHERQRFGSRGAAAGGLAVAERRAKA